MREISSFSLIFIFRVPGAGLSRHAGELGKYMKVSRFIKIRLNGGATTKLMIMWSSTILKGLTINCLEVLKLLHCFDSFKRGM